MAQNHLAWISFSVWGLSCITLSHLSTHMRCNDSAIRICNRQVAPLRALWLRAWCSPWVAFWSAGCGRWMDPHPGTVPMRGFGQSLLAQFHIISTGRSWQFIKMCSMVSLVLHVWQSCLSSCPTCQALPMPWSDWSGLAPFLYLPLPRPSRVPHIFVAHTHDKRLCKNNAWRCCWMV
jgi:hypothetical protein